MFDIQANPGPWSYQNPYSPPFSFLLLLPKPDLSGSALLSHLVDEAVLEDVKWGLSGAVKVEGDESIHTNAQVVVHVDLPGANVWKAVKPSKVMQGGAERDDLFPVQVLYISASYKGAVH